MANARKIQASTLQFLLTDSNGLEMEELLLALVASVVADGHSGATFELIKFALDHEVPAAAIREALLQLSALAGPYRAQQGLRSLRRIGSERAKPKDAFSALMGGGDGAKLDVDTQRDPKPGDAADDAEAATAAAETLGRVHGPDTGSLEAQLDKPSETLARWLRHDLYGRAWNRPGLSQRARLLISIGALYALEQREPLAAFVRAARHDGLNVTQLWSVHSLLNRMFQEGRHQELGERGFADAIGPQPKERFAPGKDPFRWD